MSRLLQALKNLEARSDKPAAGAGVLKHLAERPAAALSMPSPPMAVVAAPTKPVPSKPAPSQTRPLAGPLGHLAAGSATMLLRPAAPLPAPTHFELPADEELSPPGLELPAHEPPVSMPPQQEIAPRNDFTPRPPHRELPPQVDDPAPLPESPPVYEQPLATGPAPALAEPAPAQLSEPPARPLAETRQPTLLERTIRRTLADAERSEPFRQLADRVRTDLEKSGGRIALLVGIGPGSETHEAVLHAAAVLAERGQPILVIDADAAAHQLSGQLEFGDRAGLAEAVQAGRDPLLFIERTTFADLAVLPFGTGSASDLAAAANRLSTAVQVLEARYRLVLIDGGRADEPIAATLARLSDATYFVIRLGQTEAPDAQATLRDFRAAGARVLGCIAAS